MTAKRQAPGNVERKPWRVIGERLLEARHAKKLRQVDLAVRSGVRRISLISDLENDRDCNVTIQTLGYLCDELEVSADWLCGKSTRRKP